MRCRGPSLVRDARSGSLPGPGEGPGWPRKVGGRPHAGDGRGRRPCPGQDGQAGYRGGDAPRRVRFPGLGEEVVGDLPGHAQQQRADRGPAGESAGAGGHRGAGGQPGPQRVGGISLDADRQGDRGVEMQRVPDAGQGMDLPESRHLADADPPGPDRDCRGQRQDQQRPGPHRPALTRGGGGVVVRDGGALLAGAGRVTVVGGQVDDLLIGVRAGLVGERVVRSPVLLSWPGLVTGGAGVCGRCVPG